MKPLLLFVATMLVCQCCVCSHAQTPATEPKPAEATATPPKRTLLKYTVPKGVAGGARIDGDGGSRGTADKDKLPSLYVLTPEKAALTTREQPSLFWYQTAGSNTRFEITLTEPKNPKPLLKVGTDKSERAGIHRISLAKQNVTLKTGITYKWTVAWVPSPENRSLNVIASGAIQRVEPEAKLTAGLAEAKGVEKAGLYAQNGIWYDALETVSDAIEAAPDDRGLRALRADLLDQAGLKAAAAGERK